MFLPVVLCGSVRAAADPTPTPDWLYVAAPASAASDASHLVPCGAGDAIRWLKETIGGTWYEQATSGFRLVLREYGGKYEMEADGTRMFPVGIGTGTEATFTVWLRSSTVPSNVMLFALTNQLSAGCRNVYCTIAPPEITWNNYNGADNPLSDTPAALSDGNYHHHAFVVSESGSFAKYYLDGSLYGSANYASPVSEWFQFGGQTDYGYVGNYNSAAIYNRVLTPPEIAAEHSRGIR